MSDLVNSIINVPIYRPGGIRIVPRVRCVDGFEMSVQAGRTHYCAPRKDVGPYRSAEVGYPSEREELLMPFAEEPDDPTNTVYGYVPVEIIEQVILKHGGVTP